MADNPISDLHLLLKWVEKYHGLSTLKTTSATTCALSMLSITI